jgi:hypothetical protein
MMLFGEKYGDKVRMVKFGQSVELCGGTHTSATGTIGMFKILSEGAISAGVRRIEAVTGEKAENMLYAVEDTMSSLAEALHNSQVMTAVKKMIESNESLTKEVEEMRKEQIQQVADRFFSNLKEQNGMQLVEAVMPRRADFVKDLAYNLRSRASKLVFVVGVVNDGKPNLTIMLGDEITAQGVNAGAVRLVVIVAATLLTASAVAVSGTIGWIGLVVPHLVRRLTGNDYRYLMPASLLGGALFLLLVDDVSRNLMATEIPLGILTAFVGAPFFLWLIVRKGERV